MNKRFIIIGRSSCPYCIFAADFLSAKSIEYFFLDYNQKEEILEDYKEFHNQKTVPIILSNDLSSGEVRKVGGYSNLLELFS